MSRWTLRNILDSHSTFTHHFGVLEEMPQLPSYHGCPSHRVHGNASPFDASTQLSFSMDAVDALSIISILCTLFACSPPPLYIPVNMKMSHTNTNVSGPTCLLGMVTTRTDDHCFAVFHMARHKVAAACSHLRMLCLQSRERFWLYHVLNCNLFVNNSFPISMHHMSCFWCCVHVLRLPIQQDTAVFFSLITKTC
jgi:hypothetical protein